MKISEKAKALVAAAMVSATAAAGSGTAPVAVRWEMGQNGAEKGYYSSRFVIKNTSGRPLDANWQFFFNQFSRRVKLPDSSPVDVDEVSTTYYRVKPNSRYHNMAAGDSIVVDLLMRGTMVNVSYMPMGGHVVLNGDTRNPLPVTITYSRLDDPKQWGMRADYPDGRRIYAQNQSLALPAQHTTVTGTPYDQMPAPKSVSLGQGYTQVSTAVTIKTALLGRSTSLGRRYLERELKERGIYCTSSQPTTIELKVDSKVGPDNYEAYRLVVDNGAVTITGASETGLLNGVKTLISAIDHSQGRKLPNATVTDAPDFHYRGFMLDIARNFIPYDCIKKFVDLLAYYKINTYQFHFTDDEAWRLEIPGLPELTEVASRRGCTLDENGYLAQIFDGNGNPDDLSQSANGYLTRSQFVELLRYAHERGVRIIPEIETPGHARAAKVAMLNRYRRLIATDSVAACQYVLWDDNDQSVFTSAQSYHDNVLNVSSDGVYRFIDKVVTELQSMYKDAGLKLDIVHLGGDEVPSGSWDKTPTVQALMKREGMKSAHEVSQYYMRRITDILYPRGIRVEGWQEIALGHDDAYNQTMSKRIAGVNAWSTVGSRDVVPYTIANAGYPVILSNVTNFYMDMGYNWHQYEIGLHWGGAVDEFAAFDAQPWNIYRSARTAYDGTPIDLKRAADGKVQLSRPENVIGVQGQLWGETLRSWDMVQYYCLPKVFGLVERGWNSRPEWGEEYDDSSRYVAARNAYNQRIFRELPQLSQRGYSFRIPQPGIVVSDGKLLANTQYPSLVVRYTVDGSEPTLDSPVWTSPVAVPSGTKLIKAKAYYSPKLSSVTTYLWLDR